MGNPAQEDPGPAPVGVAIVVPSAEQPPDWSAILGHAPLVAATDGAGLERVLPGAEVALVDSRVEAPLAVARRLRRIVPDLQVILVGTAEQGQEIRRAMLFTPGLGEPWLVEPAEVDRDLVERAAGITRRRRSHARQLELVRSRPPVFLPQSARARRLSDQYLATLLELLPEPVFAIDEEDRVLFANPVARSVFAIDDQADQGILEALAPAEPDGLDLLLADGSATVRRRVALRHEDGSIHTYHATMAPIGSERPVRALILHDLTDEVRSKEALEAQALELAARTEQAARHAERTRELAAERTAVLGNIADGVVIVDEHGRISFVNQAAARMHGADDVGITPEDWPDAYNLLTVDGRPFPPEELPLTRAFRRNETVRDAEWLIRRPDGVTIHAQGSAAPVLDSEGRTIGAVLTARDVTEQRRREAERDRLLEERDRALTELQDAMRHRSRFYASMSHELRTPINAIIGYNQLILDSVYGEVPEPQRMALDRVDRAARHLLELVNDILDLSKIEAGKVDIEIAPTRLSSLIEDLRVTMEPLALEHDVELRFALDEECSRAIRTDARRTRQVLMNLFSNAIRYGAGEPVDVTCERNDGVKVRVRDRGPGIDPDRTEEIFQEFVQLHGGEQGGTGLGLAIARTLARFLGGDVTVEPAPDRGSVFTLTLPEDPPSVE